MFYAFNASDGNQLWNHTLERRFGGNTPAVAGGLVYLGNEDENFYALIGSTGGTMWKAHIGSALSSLTFANNKLFVGTTTGMLFAVNATDGQILWNCSAGV